MRPPRPDRIGIWNCPECFSPEHQEKNLLEQRREPTTNSTHICASTSGFKPGPHWWEASALTTASHLLPKCIPMEVKIMVKPVLKSFGLKMRSRNNRYLTRCTTILMSRFLKGWELILLICYRWKSTHCYRWRWQLQGLRWGKKFLPVALGTEKNFFSVQRRILGWKEKFHIFLEQETQTNSRRSTVALLWSLWSW